MIDTFKQTCEQYINSIQSADIMIGVVESTSPSYTIRLNQKILLSESQLVFSQTALGIVTDKWEKEINTEHNHGSAGFESAHSHEYDIFETDETELDTEHCHDDAGGIYNLEHEHTTKGLAEGDKVILIRKTGGQIYFVMDKVGKVNDSSAE